ncbi:MAG: hypothetical protein AAGD25_24490 [Cyanobacteria bacterium P01_F01_bin.150]
MTDAKQMTLPDNVGTSIGNLRCYQPDSSMPERFAYIPILPYPERTPSGKPIISLISSSLGAIIQLQTRLDTGLSQEAIAVEIASHFPELDADQLSVTAAPLSIESVVLSSGDRETPITPIATFQSSGLFPHTTIINTTLTKIEKERALAALAGQEQALVVTYHGNVTIRGRIAMKLLGNIAPILQQLMDDQDQEQRITADQCIPYIDQALDTEHLKLEQTQHNVFDDGNAVEKAIAAIKQQAAAHILSRLERLGRWVPDEVFLQLSAEEGVHQTYTIECPTDIALWFEGENELDYIQPSPVPIPEPERIPPDPDPDSENGNGEQDKDGDDSDGNSDGSGDDNNSSGDGEGDDNDSNGDSNGDGNADKIDADRTVDTVIQLGFDAEDIPISTITVTSGNDRARLRRSRFRAATLSTKGVGDRLTIETDYTRLGDHFQAEIILDQDERCMLMPEHLGIAPVTVDGTALPSTGVKKAQIKVNYQPTDNGTKDRHSVTFDHRDDEWLEQWYVISRSSDLAGIITWSWTETPARGASIRHNAITSDQGYLNLQPTDQ